MLFTPRQSPDCCKQVIAWRVSSSRNESSDRLLESGSTPDGESLDSFLSQLPDLWRQGRFDRRTHGERRLLAGGEHGPDPFEGVWCEVLSWLQQQPGRPCGGADGPADMALP